MLVGGAIAGNTKHLLEVVKRLWPATSKHEVSGQLDSPLITAERPDYIDNLSDDEIETLRRIAIKAMTSETKPIEED